MTEQQEQFCIVDMLFQTYAERGLTHTYVSADAAYRAMWRLFERGAIELVLRDDGDSVDVKFVSLWRQAKRHRNAEAAKAIVDIYHDVQNRGRPGRLMAG